MEKRKTAWNTGSQSCLGWLIVWCLIFIEIFSKGQLQGKKIRQMAPCIEKQQQFFQWVVLKVGVTFDYVVCSFFGKRSSVKCGCCQE